MSRSLRSGAVGVVAQRSCWVVPDHPGRSNKEASRHVLDVAATAPHEAGIVRFLYVSDSFTPTILWSLSLLLQRALSILPKRSGGEPASPCRSRCRRSRSRDQRGSRIA